MSDFWENALRETRTQEFTYDRLERLKSVECIQGLSFDAAVEIARANSLVDDCIVSTPYKGGVLVLKFKDGALVNRWVGEKD